MAKNLSWQSEGNVLQLSGELDRDSLLAFWDQRQSLLKEIEVIDVANLTRIDSTGLAMFIQLQGEWQSQGHKLVISGISENFQTLIELYGLTSLLNS